MAASELSRTQSAISRRLALLEREVGAPLFDRIGRGLVLSEVGAVLLPYAERAVAAIGDARAAVEAAKSGAAGSVHLAVVGTLADRTLGRVLWRVGSRFPGIDLRLMTATSTEVSEKVRTGEATIGLRYFEDTSPDLDCRVVRRERLVVACSASHRFAGKRLRSLDRLAHERWLVFPVPERRSETFAETILAQFAARGLDRIDTLVIDSLTAQKRLVEAGFGIALLQASAIEEELARHELARIRIDDLGVTIAVASVVRRGSYLSAGARALRDELGRARTPSVHQSAVTDQHDARIAHAGGRRR